MMGKTFVAALALGSLAACTPALPRFAVPRDAVATGFYEDVSRPDLALLEYRLAKYFAWDARPYDVVCAAVMPRDPRSPNPPAMPFDPEIERKLMARFPGLSPITRCRQEGLDVSAADTGAKATIFDVHDLECYRPEKCSAWGGYYANGAHGWSWYWIEWRGGAWHIRPRDLGIVLT